VITEQVNRFKAGHILTAFFPENYFSNIVVLFMPTSAWDK